MTTKHWLLIDAFGALVTSAVAGLVLATQLLPTGLPSMWLYCLAAAAGLFSLAGWWGYFHNSHPEKVLRLLTFLNSAYCLVTLGLCVFYWSQMTFWARIYFPVEIAIVLVLVAYETSVCRHCPSALSS